MNVGMPTGAVGPECGERHQPRSETDRAFGYLYLFRRVVVALALVGAGLAWSLGSPWLAAAGLAIAIGEWLESTYYIGVLHWGERRRVLPGAGVHVG